jgi:hypothetical protein
LGWLAKGWRSRSRLEYTWLRQCSPTMPRRAPLGSHKPPSSPPYLPMPPPKRLEAPGPATALHRLRNCVFLHSCSTARPGPVPLRARPSSPAHGHHIRPPCAGVRGPGSPIARVADSEDVLSSGLWWFSPRVFLPPLQGDLPYGECPQIPTAPRLLSTR